MAASIPATFKQYQYTKYGPVAEEWKLVQASQKVLKPGYVRIKVVNAALNPVDYKLAEYGAFWFGRTPTEESPFIVGFDAAGTVVEVGADVTAFKVGDEVYTRTPTDDFGAVAEYIAVDSQFVAPKPKNLSFQDAAGIPLAGLTSYQALVTHAKLKAGETVLILGGSSATGTLAIQFAKGIGAHVIATTSHRNVDVVKSLGADQVVDYTSQKWSEVLAEHSVDVIYDCGFEPQAWNDAAQKILKKDVGRFVTLAQIENAIESPIGAQKFYFFCLSSGEDLRAITTFVEKGQVKNVLDTVYPFEGLIDAINKVKSGRSVGKVIITVA
ncbi:Reticulon-4-interacting protein 1 [Globisporangium polare]